MYLRICCFSEPTLWDSGESCIHCLEQLLAATCKQPLCAYSSLISLKQLWQCAGHVLRQKLSAFAEETHVNHINEGEAPQKLHKKNMSCCVLICCFEGKPVMIKTLVVVDRLCHDHVLIHEDDGEDLSGSICVVGCSLVKGPARVKTDFSCVMDSIKPKQLMHC